MNSSTPNGSTPYSSTQNRNAHRLVRSFALQVSFLAFASAALAQAPAAAPAAAKSGATAAEVRFYPAGGIHPHEIEARRGYSGLLLQNGAIVNRGAGELILESARLEVLAAGRVLSSVEFGAPELDKAAQKGARLEAGGMLQALSFQFRPEILLGKDAKLAAAPRLAPGEGLLLGHQYVAYKGAADHLRLRFFGRDAAGKSVEQAGELAILTAPSAVVYRFPLAGRYFIGAGATPHSHHRWVAAEEFALDIAQLGEGMRSFRGDGAKRQDYYAYGAAVLAAADGTVVRVADGLAETDELLRQPGESFEAYNERLAAMQAGLMQQGLETIPGNLVVIDHGNGEFSHYAHLATGSAKVKVGDRVKQGQTIALLGTSGNSTEPHLHFQLTDGPDPLFSAGRPCRFEGIELPWADGDRQLQTGDVVVTK